MQDNYKKKRKKDKDNLVFIYSIILLFYYIKI